MIDSLRLSFGTFSSIKVGAPKRVDSRIAGMALSVSILPAIVVSGAAWLSGYLIFRFTHASIVAAVVVTGVEIFLTSCLHIDGLLDTADGVAALSKGGRDRALEVMKVGNSGPAALATGLLVLLLQVAALSVAISRNFSISWVVSALVARLAIVISCRTGALSARPDGLGNPFIGSVGNLALSIAIVVNAATFLALAAGGHLKIVTIAVIAAIVFGEFLKKRAEKQFGGLTGDILGSILEKVRTLALLVLIL